jgi:hypothetical protein
MVTNQTLVLKSLYWAGKEQSIPEIVKDTGLKKRQVYMVLHIFKKFSYVTIRRIETHWENGVYVPPKIFAKLRNPQLTEQTLKKRGVL